MDGTGEYTMFNVFKWFFDKLLGRHVDMSYMWDGTLDNSEVPPHSMNEYELKQRKLKEKNHELSRM